jgi:hypothetical protein
MDDRYCVAPGAFALGAADEAWFYRLFTAAMRRWGLRRDDQSQVGTLVSDTAELAWNSGDGVLTVNTPRTQAAVGFLGGRRIKLANVEIASRTPHCAITLTSLDGQPIGQSKRLLLTAVARAENTGQFWEDSSRRTVPAEGRGRAPVLVEPVEADVTIICDLAHAVCRALDASGAPKGAVPVAPGSRGFVLKLGKPHATVFYAIAHE